MRLVVYLVALFAPLVAHADSCQQLNDRVYYYAGQHNANCADYAYMGQMDKCYDIQSNILRTVEKLFGQNCKYDWETITQIRLSALGQLAAYDGVRQKTVLPEPPASGADCVQVYGYFQALTARECTLDDYNIYGGKVCNDIERRILGAATPLLDSSCRNIDRERLSRRAESARNRLALLESNPTGEQRARHAERYNACMLDVLNECMARCIGHPSLFCVSDCQAWAVCP